MTYGLSPLLYAADNCQPRIANFIIQKAGYTSKDFYQDRDSDGNTVLHICAKADNVDTFSAVASLDSGLILLPNNHGFLPIHLSAGCGSLDVLIKCVELDPKSPIYALDGSDQLPILLAAQNGHLDCFEFLYPLYDFTSISGLWESVELHFGTAEAESLRERLYNSHGKGFNRVNVSQIADCSCDSNCSPSATLNDSPIPSSLRNIVIQPQSPKDLNTKQTKKLESACNGLYQIAESNNLKIVSLSEDTLKGSPDGLDKVIQLQYYVQKNDIGAIRDRVEEFQGLDFDLTDEPIVNFATWHSSTDIILTLITELKLKFCSGSGNVNPYHIAASENRYDLVDIFAELANQGIIDKNFINAKDSFGRSPLQIAVEYANYECIQRFTQHGGELYDKFDDQKSKDFILLTLLGAKDVKSFTQNIRVIGPDTLLDNVPLIHHICNQPNLELFMAFMSLGPNTNVCDDKGMSVIAHLIDHKNVEYLDSILSFPGMLSLINQPDSQGNTPLILAAKTQNLNVCRAILMKSPKYSKNKEGKSASDYFKDEMIFEYEITCLSSNESELADLVRRNPEILRVSKDYLFGICNEKSYLSILDISEQPKNILPSLGKQNSRSPSPGNESRIKQRGLMYENVSRDVKNQQQSQQHYNSPVLKPTHPIQAIPPSLAKPPGQMPNIIKPPSNLQNINMSNLPSIIKPSGCQNSPNLIKKPALAARPTLVKPK